MFTKAYETADAFILMVGITLHILPKRDFTSEADVARLRVLPQDRLGSKANLHGP